MKELKSKIEALLYCVPDGLTIDKIAESIKFNDLDQINNALLELKEEFENRSLGLRVLNDGKLWKFDIIKEHSEVIKRAAEPELDKGTLQTLAYIAWRGGSRQCDVVRVRSTKAYRHIKILIDQEFIESEKTGLTKFLTPTKKFYRYFNIKERDKTNLLELKEESKEKE
jgi:segregation and condensation protein B